MKEFGKIGKGLNEYEEGTLVDKVKEKYGEDVIVAPI